MVVTVQVTVTVQGRVRDASYRTACVQRARLLDLRGWVRNRHDGTVEASLAGPGANVLGMREWTWGGPDNAQVAQLDVVTGDHEASVPGFEIRPTM